MEIRNFKKTISISIMAALVCAALLLSGCSGSRESSDTSAAEKTGSMELSYAAQFSVDYNADGTSLVKIGDGLEYLLVPEGTEAPDAGEDITVIRTPVKKAYVAASSSMDLINTVGGMDSVIMTSTEAKDWAIPEIREAVESDKVRFIGKYSAPDYEALLEDEADIAIESTMIYHSPQVKEAIEELGIPVLVERSSYENDPLARLEWIKLYGLLFGREDEAEAFFDDAAAKVASVDTASIKETPSVAFFSVNSGGAVVVRKPGDYITKMIETAGGKYALDGITAEEDNALSTMNMQMEAFYDKAVDADILIYNSAIESDLTSLSDLTALSEQFEDFAAVKSGNVWCTNKNVYQKTTGAADMITEMNKIFAGAEDDSGMEYFHKLK